MQTLTPDRRAALRATSSMVIVRGALRGKAAVEQMADDMRVFATRCDAVTADDLQLAGWSAAQIARHGADARARAQALSARS